MNLERHFWASGLHRQGYTLETALGNKAIAKALMLCELARIRALAQAERIKNQTTHNKGATHE